MLASVVISTYNRADALPATLAALAEQDVPPEQYEVLVIDDGSADDTSRVLGSVSVPYRLRTFRLEPNKGVSAGRNVGLRNAEGDNVIMISDDLIVPRAFLSAHVATLTRFPDTWVVGGFRQLESLTSTAFGRFLDELEAKFERARLAEAIDDGIYRMTVPTARNLSLPRADIQRVGLFDERFRVTCEDQDLATRAASLGITFIYNAALECIHNDQAADLRRYCRFQERGAVDTARLCDKYPELHARAPIVAVNCYLGRGDSLALAGRKLLKRLLSAPVAIRWMARLIATAERRGVSDRWLFRAYRLLIGVYTFRGFREGLREVGGRNSNLMLYLTYTKASSRHRRAMNQP
jgi:glycosyltransferase involved in cell wall biosynthesis